MGSLEDLFVRVEFAGRTDYGSILNWLSDDGKRNKASYRNVATILQEPFSIRQRANKFVGSPEEADDLRSLLSEAKSTEIADSKTINLVQTKLDLSEESEKEEVQKQEQLIAEDEARKFLIISYKGAATAEEEKSLRRELRDQLPNSLRSLRGWETRRGREAFQSVFG